MVETSNASSNTSCITIIVDNNTKKMTKTHHLRPKSGFPGTPVATDIVTALTRRANFSGFAVTKKKLQ